MMNAISEFLVDFLFYTMIEGFIFYFIYFTYKNLKFVNFFDFFKNCVRCSMLYSFSLCLISRIFPFGIYQTVAIIFYIFITKFYFDENYIDSIYVSFLTCFIIVIFEFILIISLNSFFGINIMSSSLTSFSRVLFFIFAKILEISVVFIWRVLKMKFAIGTVTRR